MLWVMYFSVFILFRHAYHEIAIAASTLWIAFLISFMGINHVAPGTPIAAYSLFISTVVMIAVAGITGMAMLFNASREFSREFRENAPAKGNARAARRRRRASR
jgi:amino acid transporter